MKLEEKNNLRILTADEGKTLSRKGDDNNFADTFYMGVNDSPENFTEITKEEADAIIELMNQSSYDDERV